ncbi:hypothetical protein CDAR_199411 [Caerostris darwini]|uniref:Uncharacterized protein n=1 Tax=Caerostris darwini TaxID=1538125 RepID=A0AAV4X0A6_9ARAC|nr:hypothetical protein CDAR_199411 [Caerostris darwini]
MAQNTGIRSCNLWILHRGREKAVVKTQSNHKSSKERHLRREGRKSVKISVFAVFLAFSRQSESRNFSFGHAEFIFATVTADFYYVRKSNRERDTVAVRETFDKRTVEFSFKLKPSQFLKSIHRSKSNDILIHKLQ